jgi:hypothetical protein
MKGETPGHCVNLSHSLIHCVVCMMGLEVERRMGGGAGSHWTGFISNCILYIPRRNGVVMIRYSTE